MKKSILLSLVILNLVCTLSFGGYTGGGVAVEVPFAFVAGGETLGPGYYFIEKMSGSGQAILLIRNAENTVVRTVLCTSSVATKSDPSIEFIKIGASHVLAAVKTRDSVFHLVRASETVRKLQVAAK